MAPLLLASGVKRKADTKAGAAEATSGSQQSLFLIAQRSGIPTQGIVH